MRTRRLVPLLLASVAFGCGHGKDSVTPPATFNAGAVHNQFLATMLDRYGDTGGSGQRTDVALVVPRSIAVFSEQLGIPADEVRPILVQSLRNIRDLNSTGILRGRSTDPDALADYFVGHGFVPSEERLQLDEFLHDLLAVNSDKSADFGPMIAKWSARSDLGSLTAPFSILSSSVELWSAKRFCNPAPCSNAEIVIADVVGGVLGSWFPGLGQLIGGAVASYMAAEYATSYDPDFCGPIPLPPYGPVWPAKAGIGFPPRRAATWGVIVAALLSGAAYYFARRRYTLSPLWSVGMLVFLASTTVTIAARMSHDPNTDPWWLMLILAAAGLTLVIRGTHRKADDPTT